MGLAVSRADAVLTETTRYETQRRSTSGSSRIRDTLSAGVPCGLPPDRLLTLDVITDARYAHTVIRSFRGRDTERLSERQPVRRWSPELQRAALRKLRMLDAAERLDDLRVPPGNRLERLSGDRAQQHSIRINEQWRICFRWRSGDAYDVEIVDYHA